MAAILAAIIPLIIALLPYLEKLIEALLAKRNEGGGLHPLTQRRLARVLSHCGRLQDVCSRLNGHAAALGVYAHDEGYGELPPPAPDED